MIKTPTNKQQTGFTLIEAMVALLIFSVGLLGLAGMQMSGMQNNHSASVELSQDQYLQIADTLEKPAPKKVMAMPKKKDDDEDILILELEAEALSLELELLQVA